MTASDLGVLVVVFLGAALVAGAGGWSRTGARVWPPISLGLLAAAALLAATPAQVEVSPHALLTLLVVLAGLLAVVGGGPMTSQVFAFVDRHEHAGAHDASMGDAGRVLRGGAWIGALERAAIFASLAAAQPEGVAIVLALKGLGRYPELRSGANTGTAERFIIGTFTSVLWAAACAGIVRLLLGR